MPVLAGCASCVNVGPNLGGFLATRCSSILCSQHGGIDSKVLGAQGQDLFQRDSVPAMAPVMPSGATHAEGLILTGQEVRRHIEKCYLWARQESNFT